MVVDFFVENAALVLATKTLGGVSLMVLVMQMVIAVMMGWEGSGGQCDQKKIAECLKKLPKNDFTRKMIDFDTITKIA